jgi:hypothetical protein
VRRESRTAVIRERLKGSRIVRIHSRYLRRVYRSIGDAVAGPSASSFGRGLGVLLRWLHQRAKSKRWCRLRLWRRFAATHVEMYPRNARLQRICRRRVRNRPPSRVHWVIKGYPRSGRVDDIYPAQKLGKVVFSRRARIRAWMALARRDGSA